MDRPGESAKTCREHTRTRSVFNHQIEGLMLDVKKFRGEPFGGLLEQVMDLPIAEAIQRIKPTSEEIRIAISMGIKAPALDRRNGPDTDEEWSHRKAMSIRGVMAYQRDLLGCVVILRNLLASQ
jgi:hypothetical protein